ncbi:MAG TPA: NAD-dependent epimerase/dehydratase family protein [Planctomycetota bacterium]|nr:NAD-dependent epimerase/dehydratase family protein [Planctomycetota bacterium]
MSEGNHGRRALVTGGAGFIGHHLVAALLRRGLEVTVLDDLSMGRRENVPPQARFVQGDVRDPEQVTVALNGVDCVFHEAAIVSIRASVEGFVRDAEVNLVGTLNLLQCMADRGVKKAVFASSMAVYADSEAPVALAEDSPLRPISPYGVAKLASEQYWLLMGRHFGLDTTVLRYFNTYGPGQTPTPYVGVITIFINRLLRGEAPVIYGDGEQRRDFVHVDDVVSANLALLDADVAGRTFNVGTGHATSVSDIARELTARLAPELKPRHAAPVEGEMRNAIADASALRKATGWTPSRPRPDFDHVVEYWRARAAAK